MSTGNDRLVSTFGLDEVLGALSADLLRAQVTAAAHGFGLSVAQAEVELAFTVEHGHEGKGGINLRVFGVGVGGDVAKTSSEEWVHRIKLTLQPAGGPADERVAVAGRSPRGPQGL